MVVTTGAVLGLLAAVIWGFGAVIAKRGLANGGSALLLAILSATFGTTLFWGVLVLDRGSALMDHLTAEIILLFVLGGVFASLVGRLVHYTSIDRIGATVTNGIITTSPMFAVILAFLLLGEPIRVIEAVAIIIIITGMATLTFSKGGNIGGWSRWKIIIPVGAALLFAAGDVTRRYAFVTTEASPIEGTAVNSLAAFLGFTTYVILRRKEDIFVVPRRAYVSIAVAGLMTPLGLLALMAGLSVDRVVIVTPVAATSPLFTIFFGYFFITDLERIDRRVIVGSLAVVIGIFLLSVF